MRESPGIHGRLLGGRPPLPPGPVLLARLTVIYPKERKGERTHTYRGSEIGSPLFSVERGEVGRKPCKSLPHLKLPKAYAKGLQSYPLRCSGTLPSHSEATPRPPRGHPQAIW